MTRVEEELYIVLLYIIYIVCTRTIYSMYNLHARENNSKQVKICFQVGLNPREVLQVWVVCPKTIQVWLPQINDAQG